ncbi:MAG TPA: class I poly(R)-hydroxyalkanoic acid synthase [Sphingopyxis sp.]|nr:class I poly(R)-hydroxyalkanoic acid synthase [Sphingopyxis sp.]
MNSMDGGRDSDPINGLGFAFPSAEDWQAWANVFAQAQKLMLDFTSAQSNAGSAAPSAPPADPSQPETSSPHHSPAAAWNSFFPSSAALTDFSSAFWKAAPWNQAQAQTPLAQLWADQMQQLWQASANVWGDFSKFPFEPFASFAAHLSGTDPLAADRRFAATDWHQHPAYILLRQTYGLFSDQLLQAANQIEGVDATTRAKLQFAARSVADALSPTNIVITNPDVMRRAAETRGESLLSGLKNMLADLARGQLSHVDRNAFTLGVNIATTPGKVMHETPLYQLIHYQPTTDQVQATPLLIFPPWINRFYILDLNPQKSFVKWALEQGLSVFMVSWKSADASMADILWDDYVRAQVDAIDVVRDLLKQPSVHCIGYCVAGTTLAATLAMLAAQGEDDRVRSVTFFTAQVDFEQAGDLKHFVDEGSLALLQQLSGQGFLDGRYMAATFNALRSKDLIWNYVVKNYLLGEDYPAFDLLYWNGDTTNLPAKWHQQYLTDLYLNNHLVSPSALQICDTPIDLRRIKTPAFVQAGREDHIAPLASVWRIMEHLSGPKEFVIAGSGHIAGVINPPSAGKYQYWTGDSDAPSLDAFEASAVETSGSWWPHWIEWLLQQEDRLVPVKGARLPGKGKRKSIEDAPGRYVRTA